MARRIMLVEVTPRRPTAPINALWSTTDKDASITVSGGDLTAAKSVVHASNWGCVRSTRAARAGQWYWETTVIYSGLANFGVGVAKDNEALNWQPGTLQPADPYRSIAIDKTGDVRADGIVHMNIGAIPSGAVVRHWLDLDEGAYRVAVNGGPWTLLKHTVGDNLLLRAPANITLPHFAYVGFLRTIGTSPSCTANFGQNPFVYTVPAGANPGIYDSQPTALVPLYLSSDKFGTGPFDTPASQLYDARIVTDQDVEVTREAGCWVWGNSAQSKSGQIVVSNVDGGLDEWADFEWRDAEARIYWGLEGQTRAQFTLWTGTRVDDIRFDDQRIAIVLADVLAPLQAPIQPEVYPEDHPIEAEIGNPIPIVFGLPFYVTGVRMSPLKLGADAYAWQIHDGLNPLLTGKGTIFDNGIDITAACVTWPAVGAVKGFRVSGTAPKGKVTCHATGFGSTTVLTIVEQAVARLPSETVTPPAIVQPVPVSGINAWAAMYIRQPRTVLDVVREAMDSVCGWAVPSRSGTQLRLGRVREPQGQVSVLQLDPSNVLGTPVIELDLAPGLTTRLAGRRNWSPHQFNEIATSITDPVSASYNPNTAANLQAEYMATRTGSPQVVNESMVSTAYAQARQNEAKGTILQDASGVKAEANRVCTLWFPTRHFVYLTALLSQADILEPGDIVTLLWPRYGLNATAPVKAGNQFLVVSVRSRFWSKRVDLKLWGSLPITQYGDGGKGKG